MTFYHWSDDPIELDPFCEYKQKPLCKPSGLWFDVDGAWKTWCKHNDFREMTLKHCYEVIIPDSHDILKITNAEQLDDFTEMFRDRTQIAVVSLDWPTITQIFDAIVIAPYIWSRRLYISTTWYYGWDCASGCVWNLNGVSLQEKK